MNMSEKERKTGIDKGKQKWKRRKMKERLIKMKIEITRKLKE
jgi:hypothetical protein